MSNLHAFPADTTHELQAVTGDLLPPVILSTTWPTVPVSSMTLSAFATRGYVRNVTDLRYVTQPAAPVTLVGANGTYWLALYKDTSSSIAQWTRVAGTYYLWHMSAAHPGDPPGGLVFAQVTVAGGVITAVTPVAAVAGLRAAWTQVLQLGTIAGYQYGEGLWGAPCTGFADPAPIVNVTYTIVANLVVLNFPDITGTSNFNSFGILGMPAALSTPRVQRCALMVQDGGVFKSGYMQINGTTITVYPDAQFGPWVASGAKGSFGGTFVYRTT